MRSVMVTGANGFVGQAFCHSLALSGRYVLPAVRSSTEKIIGGRPSFIVGEIDIDTNWKSALSGIDVVVHLASRVHVMQDCSNDSLLAYRRVNTDGALNLARQAADAGVSRFIFVSSVKVNGEGGDHVYSEDDAPSPADPYAISKWEAEQGLIDLSASTGMEVVIVRPPLVYGPGVKANFLRMMHWLNRGVPLPFGWVHNRRSLVALGNLVDFLMTCVDHSTAANQVFLVSDNEDLTTPELLMRTAAAMGKKAHLIGIPENVLKVGGLLLGKRDMSERLCGSLQVSISKARNLMGWVPPMSVDEGLRVTAERFLADLAKS